ncbi:MAG: aldo/keto reductase [Erysipelotrichaceae bacterium]|jgi:predicted aldo/keto reductase-like oxidoreductase
MKFGFGLMRLPIVNNDDKQIDMKQFCAMADDFIAAGGTYFDTAYIYHGGNSESAFKEAVVNRYKRDMYTIADKMPMFLVKEENQLEKIFNEQLERCGVEYFDYYLLHSLTQAHIETVEKINAVDFILKKKECGYIKKVGFSFHDTAEVLDKFLTKYPEMEFVQLQINYLDYETDDIQSRKCYEIAAKHNKPVVVMEPVKGGLLAELPEEIARVLKKRDKNASMASWAIRFAASLENVKVVLSGMSNMQQMEDNLSYMREFVSLSDEEKRLILEVGEAVKNYTTIACTKCRYCENNCPMGLAIADYFELYNDYKRYGNAFLKTAVERYNKLTVDRAKAGECLECGACEDACPQHLKIRDFLATIASAFE